MMPDENIFDNLTGFFDGISDVVGAEISLLLGSRPGRPPFVEHRPLDNCV
jgi:hypothetical protein